MILHIAEMNHWQNAQGTGFYETPSLITQGFIHCSETHQLLDVANWIFRGRSDLIFLVIDPERLNVEIRYENLEGGTQLFPHIYGSVPLEAVVKTHCFQPGPDGLFSLPKDL